MRKRIYILFLILSILMLAGCGRQTFEEPVETVPVSEQNEEEPEVIVPEPDIKTETEDPETEVEPESTEAEEEPEAEMKPEPEAEEELSTSNGFLVCIDAGHQQKGNSEKEPIGPGASEMKAKVTGGTTGVSTGLREYELNLQVALKLEEILLERGYEVLMVRTSHEVNMSNSERAAVANEAGADVFIRIHANGSENSSVNGAMTICQTPSNPYNGSLYEQSRKLADCVLDAFVEKTGAKKQRVWETDTMSGINWASVPTTIVEMGYMTNPTEDQNMASEDYQYLMAEGMADGIDCFLEIE